MEVLEKITLFKELVCCGGNISTWCYDSDGSLIFCNCSEQTFLSSVFDIFGCKDTMLKYGKKHNHPIIIGTSIGLQWIAAFEKTNNNLKHIWIIGPVFYQDLNIHSIEIGLQNYNDPRIDMEWTIKFFDVMKTIPTLPTVIASRYALMLHYCITNEHLALSDVDDEGFDIDLKNVVPLNKDRHEVWMAEQGLLEAVRTGDINYQEALSRSMSISSGVPIHSDDALRQSKTSIIVFTSLVCRAAIEGGLSPEEAYSLNDNYIQTVELAKSLSELHQIPHMMYDDFINRVHKCKQTRRLSTQIQKCVDYISKNLNKKITAKDLASFAGYTEYYLTNKFKKETGLSVSDYVKVKKIERAKVLLKSTDSSIQEIALELGFCSRNYFSNVFFKVTNKTPLQYRENK